MTAMIDDTAMTKMANDDPSKLPTLRVSDQSGGSGAAVKGVLDLTLSIEESTQDNSNGRNIKERGNGATSIAAPTTTPAPTTTILSLPTELRISILQYAILNTFPKDYNSYDYGNKSYPLPAARMTCRTMRHEAQTAYGKSLRMETKYLQAYRIMIEQDSPPSMRQWEEEEGMGLPLSLRNYELDVNIMQHRAVMLMWV
ncbi:hypothetical protein LTR95_009597 [Oleoguttula sp. CCFEE 5521]